MKGLVQTSSEATGPYLLPLWLLVVTPSAIRLELASRRAENSLSYSDVTRYDYIWYKIFITYVVCVSILWPLRLVWLLVCCLHKEVYLQIFKCVSFWLLLDVVGSGKIGSCKRLTTPAG